MADSQQCSFCGATNQEGTDCSTCGQMLNASFVKATTLSDTDKRLLPGQILHQRYTIISLLGCGGMGAVYKAADQQFNERIIALKEMKQQNNLSDAIEQFKKEAHLLAGLTHPHLPRIYDYFTENQHWYLVMDYIEGETLESYLAKAPGGTLSLDEVLEIGIQLASVLQYLHSRSTPIIFRDLKPLNVMITPETHVYLIDFGIARYFKPGQAQDTMAYVSQGYAAPEQFGYMQTTPRSDIFSLGAVLYHLLTGNNPTSFLLQPVQGYHRTIPPALSTLITQMMQMQPAQRPASMLEVKQTLEYIRQRHLQSSVMTEPPHDISSVAPTVLPIQFTQAAAPLSSSPAHRKRSVLAPLIIIVIIFVLVASTGTLAWFLSKKTTQTANTIKTLVPMPSIPTTIPTSSIATPTSTQASGSPTSTQASGSPAISYPSYAQAQSDISYYYTHESDFHGKQLIQHFDSVTYGPYTGPVDQPQFTACAEYQYASVSSPDVALGTARHTFTFQYFNGTWSVIDMGNWNSC